VAAFFYLFSIVLIASAVGVITVRNPVHAVLLLILAFCNGAGLFLLQGAEFLAMILVVVYVGAVAVLFLFVVMMLDVDFSELKEGFRKHISFAAGVGGAVLIELSFVAWHWTFAATASESAAAPIAPQVTNTVALGEVLYTKYAIFFEAAGLVLLTAMLGAIVLTLRHRPNVKRQSIEAQNARTAKSVVELKKTPFRAGV